MTGTTLQAFAIPRIEYPASFGPFASPKYRPATFGEIGDPMSSADDSVDGTVTPYYYRILMQR